MRRAGNKRRPVVLEVAGEVVTVPVEAAPRQTTPEAEERWCAGLAVQAVCEAFPLRPAAWGGDFDRRDLSAWEGRRDETKR